jgi:DoxX-like family
MRSTQAESSSKKMIWTGRIVTVLASLFMLLDGVMKIVKPVQVLEATARLGYPVSALTGIGVTLIACTLIYVIPRSSILGAILLTGYLGGAVASNVRAGSGWFETIFPTLIAALVWGGIWMRDRRVRNLLWTNRPLSSQTTDVPKAYREIDQCKSMLI